MRIMKKLVALILCAALLLSMAACKPQNPDPVDDSSLAKNLYTQACDTLSSSSHTTLELLITTITTVDGDEFSEQSTQTLTYQAVGTEEAVIAMDESILFSIHNTEDTEEEEEDKKEDPTSYQEIWYQDTVYAALDATYRYQSSVPKADIAKRYTPVILLDAGLYGNITKETSETETVIHFAQPTAAEHWALPQEATLTDASGSARINAEGILTQMDYTITYQYGPAQVKQTVQSKPLAAPKAVSAPSDRDAYASIGYADALRTSVSTVAKLMQVDSLTFTSTDMLVSEAAGYVQNGSQQVNLHGRKEKTIAKLDTSIYVMNSTQESELKREELFLDGKLTTTVNNGLPSTDRSITWEDIRTYIIDFLAIIVSSPDYWEDVSVTDTGFAYLMEFKLNDNFGNTTQNEISTMLWNDPSFLLNLASKYTVEEVTGYLSVDKYTGLPVATGYYYKGIHTIEGQDYALTQQFDQAITSPSKGAYKEITGKRLPETEPEAKPTPLFYQVTGKDGQKMYLFGTIHIGDERTAYLPDAIRNAFVASDALALECNMELFEKKVEEDEKLAEQLSDLFYTSDGTNVVEKRLDKETYTKACQYLKAVGGYTVNMPYAKPHLWSEAIEDFYLDQGYQLHADQGVEMRLIDWAEELDKDILEIESAMDQLKMLSNFSYDLQMVQLEAAMESTSREYWEEAMTLYEKWCAGDEAVLREAVAMEWDTQDMTEEEIAEQKPLFDEYYKKMDTDRNKAMLKTAIDYLESGEVIFYAVGLAHLLDDATGLVNALQQSGYTVERIAY